ncbi:KTSC domain-containing protein [Pandoraea sputorum]|nr:KTSC domain-containing protein [Pandoraea sputorum]
MRISFRSGGTYDFCGVPKNVYEQFMASASMGRYYHAHIENRYRC